MKKEIRFAGRRMTAAVLCTVLLIGSVLHLPVEALTSDEVREQQDALHSKLEQLEAKQEKLKEDEKKQLDYYHALVEKRELLETQCDTASIQIDSLNASIDELDAEIRQSNDEIAATLSLLKERIKLLYKSGNASTLQILLSAKDWSDFSMKAEVLKAVTAHDKKLMDEISAHMKQTAEQRKELAAQKQLVSSLSTTLEKSLYELIELEDEAQRVLDELKEQQIEVETTKQKTAAEEDALALQLQKALEDEELARKAAEAKRKAEEEARRKAEEEAKRKAEEEAKRKAEEEARRKAEEAKHQAELDAKQEPDEPDEPDEPAEEPIDEPDEPFSFGWPCPGYVYISAYWGDGRGHKGIDFAAYYGTPIVAAESGYVVIANDTNEWGGGWGYHVSIYHNETYSTLYAHCSRLAVQEGEYVQKGQVIAYVGSTGDSTGNHLHFEVYENGTRVNPAPFIGLA